MKFLCCDFETTGLDPKVNQPLSFCGIIDSIGNKTPIEDLPRIHCYFRWQTITVDAIAGKMNNELIQKIFNKEYDGKWILPNEFQNKLRSFLTTNGIQGNVTIAGKNPVFDIGFLVALGFRDIEFRTIDPAVYYLRSEDERVPGLATCLKRAGLDSSGIHDEQFDVEAVIKLLRKYGHI